MTPAILKSKLLPLIQEVWNSAGFGTALPEAFAWSCRGYYRDSLGKPGVNDRGINDDAVGFISPNVDYRVQANVDPSSVHRPGVASLKTNQVVWYRPGWHGYASIHGHAAFRQDSAVVVKRDGTENFPHGPHKKYGIHLGGGYWTDRGFAEKFWTNLHRQTGNSTSSLGCQTVPAATWKAFHALVMAELARVGQERFPCIILEGPIN